jgi:TolA-binding protein
LPAPEPITVTTPPESRQVGTPVPAITEVPAAPPRPPKPEEIQAEAVEAQIEPEPETDFTGMQELGLVEEVARLRKAYGRSLLALKDYYLARGAQHKIEWVEQELKAFEATPKIRYLTIAEVVGPELKPLRRIAAADQLYKEGLDYKNYPAFPPAKKDYLKNALDKFQAIIEKYPESDKIDDAAFRMGEIYGGWYFEDWARAVQCYERCWQWDPETQYAARFNAAKIYEERLKNRIKAVELYNAVLLKSRNPDEVNQARDRIKALTGK